MRVAEFACEDDALDRYLRSYASQDVRRGVARVFVASPLQDAGSISAAILPDALRKRLPRYPVSIALLRRLAVDVSFQRRGLRSGLLAGVCQKVAAASKLSPWGA